MPTFISILRGINVSKQNSIKMNLLQSVYESLGFSNVVTYIQSGNVVFNTSKKAVKTIQENIHKAIQETFGFDVPVIVMSKDTFKNIIENNPLLQDKTKATKFIHFTLLAASPTLDNLQTIIDKKQSDEEIVISDNVVYLYCPNGYGTSKLSNSFLETKLKVNATTRNYNTTLALLKLAEEIEKKRN